MDLINDLGLDPDNLEWQQLAFCNTMETSWFFDLYESDQEIAKAVDATCLSCPVVRECGQAGMESSEFGVWGGIYWAGNKKADKAKNSHKTPEVWAMIQEKYSGI